MKSLKLIIAFQLFATLLWSQTERSLIRQGNREFRKGQYLESEISYRSALEKNPASVKGNFNLGGALYKQDKLDEARGAFEGITATGTDAKVRAKAYHNLGNTHYRQQKLAEAADAYKNALRLNPNDNETKYNLSEVLRMLREQQNQQQNKGDGKDNKNDKQNDKKDDKQKQNDQQDKQNDQQHKQNQQPKEQKISPEDARRMLEAIQKNERDVQQKVLEQQAKQAKVRVEKNW